MAQRKIKKSPPQKKKSPKPSTKKILVHAAKGGQGKTTVTANLGLLLASLGKRVLLVDGCSSKGLQMYFNVAAEHGIFEFLKGTPLPDLVGELRKDLFLLPAGDLIQAEKLLDQDKVSPVSQLEEQLLPWEGDFDFILFDSSPTEDNRLFFNVLYYVDLIISPVETKQAGFDKLVDFYGLIEGINPRLREKAGKRPLKIDVIVPYWFSRTTAKQRILEEMEKNFSEVLTPPVTEATGVHECWMKGESLAERLATYSTPRSNELAIQEVFDGIVQKLLAV